MAKSRARNQKKAKKVTRTRVQTRRNSQSKIRGKKQSKNRNALRTKRARRRSSGGDMGADEEVQKAILISKFPAVVETETEISQLINKAAREYYSPVDMEITNGLSGIRDGNFKYCPITQKATARQTTINFTQTDVIITCAGKQYTITLEKNQNNFSDNDKKKYDVVVKDDSRIIYRYKPKVTETETQTPITETETQMPIIKAPPGFQ